MTSEEIYKKTEELIDEIYLYANMLHQAKEYAKKDNRNLRTQAIKSAYNSLSLPVKELKDLMS